MKRNRIEIKKKRCTDCGLMKYIFSHGRCEQCAKSEYKQIEKKQTRISKISGKKKIDLIEYLKRKIKYLNNHTICEANLEVCSYHSTDVHHKAGRIGKLLLDETKWLSVCRRCHQWIENHPIEAKEMGYSLNRL